ncbi:MAG TPA: pseudouridine-5'-phosphate glycosidase [Aggregatilineales bacterium]|nr:pseudouridine-5'-phosphate glycosidase [Aggregatilineales bacterium]
MPITDYLTIAPPVQEALDAGQPVVALESTVISHGLPRPHNYETARQMEAAIREAGAVPATVGLFHGQIVVGCNDDQLRTLAYAENIRKVSRRDFPIAIARRELGATTVAGTMIAAYLAGIQVFATGGIGGVHRGDADDVSADLPELAMTSVAVVCAGAKAILDLPRTLEYLETAGVPVLGYGTDTFPAFYAASSGLPVDTRVDSPAEAAAIIRAKWEMGLQGAVLVTVPPPADLALPAEEVEAAVEAAMRDASVSGVTGKALTPYLLARVSEITAGRSLEVNIGLLVQNARIAEQIAVQLADQTTQTPS